MASPTVYSWQDPSAPQITRGTTSEYQNLFQKVLVDGYGSKVGAGWTIPFADASGFIIKQGGTDAIKACMKIYDFNASGQFCKVEASDDYTDFTTPVDQFDGFNTYDRLSVGYATVATYNIPWMFFATATSIYMMFGYNNFGTDSPSFDSAASSVFRNHCNYFGDYVPFNATQQRKQISIHYQQNSTQETSLCNGLTSNSTTISQKLINSGAGGLAGSFDASWMTIQSQLLNVEYDIGLSASNTNVPSFPNPTDGSLYLDSPKILSERSIIGSLPSFLYSPASKPLPITKNIYTFDGSGGYTGSKIYVINTYSGQFYLHDGDWGVE